LQIENKLFSIAFGRNAVLQESRNNSCPRAHGFWASEERKRAVKNRRAAWLKADALVKESKNFRPYGIRIKWDVHITAHEEDVAASQLSAADALSQIEREIGQLEAQSDRFAGMLGGELPETLQHGSGTQLVEQLEQRKNALDAAQARLIKHLRSAA
jgi:hypothetical protein